MVEQISEEERKKQVLTALDADIKTLYASIGYISNRSQLGVAPTEKESLIELGKLWFSKKEGELKSLVCTNKSVEKLFLSTTDSTNDKVNAILLIADLIVSICEGVPAIYIAVLITKIGLKGWCQSGNNDR